MTLQKPGRPDIGKTALTSKNNTWVLSLFLLKENSPPPPPPSKILNHTFKRDYTDHSYNEITDVRSRFKLHYFGPQHLLQGDFLYMSRVNALISQEPLHQIAWNFTLL